jgi:hypothetical protein
MPFGSKGRQPGVELPLGPAFAPPCLAVTMSNIDHW